MRSRSGWAPSAPTTRGSTRATWTPRASPGGSRSARAAAGGSELELLSGPLEEELRRLAEEGVQSLLLEGGPTLAASFFAADLVDKLLLFVAPEALRRRAGLLTALRLRSRSRA